MDYVQTLSISATEIAAFCEKHHIRKLSLFGSVLRDDFRPDSDVDVLVEFDPDHIPDLFRFAGMQDELTQLLGRTADLNTPEHLSRHFRKKALAAAQVIYERAG